MRAGKSVDLATVSFPTQGGATDFFKEMLNRYQPGAWVNDTDSLHLAALLERHTEWASVSIISRSWQRSTEPNAFAWSARTAPARIFRIFIALGAVRHRESRKFRKPYARLFA